MAVLTTNGITFGDSTSLNSKYGIIPQSSVVCFFQAAAPTGWSQVTTHNDKALRVVSGTGGGSAGSISFSSAFPTSTTPISGTITVTGTVGNTTLTTPQIPAHSHPNGSTNGHTGGTPGNCGTPSYPDCFSFATQTGTGNNGGNGAHSHPWSGSGPFTSSIDLRVQYVDIILCSFS